MDEGEQDITSESSSLYKLQDLKNMEDEKGPCKSTTTHEIITLATEDNKPASTSSDTKNILYNWTKEEKFDLYLGLKIKGSKNVKEIQENIPTKTVEEIETAIAHYKDRANQTPECTSRKLKVKMKKVKRKQFVPLTSWAKLITDNFEYNEIETEMVSALRLIADLENIPPSAWTEQIDFRKVYHQIADAMEGKSLPVNGLIAEVLYSCILETAILSKQFIHLSTFINIINSINCQDRSIGVLPRPTKNCELSIVRHLASQQNYNPLGIPEENLLPMSSDPIVYPK